MQRNYLISAVNSAALLGQPAKCYLNQISTQGFSTSSFHSFSSVLKCNIKHIYIGIQIILYRGLQVFQMNLMSFSSWNIPRKYTLLGSVCMKIWVLEQLLEYWQKMFMEFIQHLTDNRIIRWIQISSSPSPSDLLLLTAFKIIS